MKLLSFAAEGCAAALLLLTAGRSTANPHQRRAAGE